MFFAIIFILVLNPTGTTTKNEPCSKPILYKTLSKSEKRSRYVEGIITFNVVEKTAFMSDPFSTYCKLSSNNGSNPIYLRLLTTANKSLKKGECDNIKKVSFKAVDQNGNNYMIKIKV